MKINPVNLLFVSIVFFGASFSGPAHIYIKIRPVAPVIVMTPQPTIVHVWIDDEWEPYGTSYRYVSGHWDTPTHDGAYWNRGHWKRHHNLGHEWIQGSWKGKNNYNRKNKSKGKRK
ncbi:MAG: hypothetical protein HYU69_00930 [Bacteroidetes bacterium]|nr:hypothetical protein [Bacteroidota bacterium]